MLTYDGQLEGREPRTLAELLEEMRAINKEGPEQGDPEEDHSMADALMCEMLIALGHKEFVEEFLKVERWYA